jgi:hypothetical protein
MSHREFIIYDYRTMVMFNLEASRLRGNVDDLNGMPHHFKQGQSSVGASINQGLSGTPGIIAVTSVDATGTFRVTTWPQSSPIPTNTFGFMFQVVAK